MKKLAHVTPDWVDDLTPEMRWTDMPAAARAAITAKRTARGGRLRTLGAIWFNHPFRCSVCGVHQDQTNGVMHLDHCHLTGVQRGWLCHSCNISEGKQENLVWDVWRVTAPHIPQRIIDYGPYIMNTYAKRLTDEESRTLPMPEAMRLACSRPDAYGWLADVGGRRGLDLTEQAAS